MARHHLAVDDREAPGIQALAQVHQGHLGGIADLREHGLPVEDAPQADPVEPAYQLAVLPYLDRVGQAPSVQAAVGSDHLRRPPGPGPVPAGP